MMHRIAVVSAAVLALLLAAPSLSAQVDVSGTWRLSVTTDGGVTHPILILQQDGSALSGSYSSDALGDNQVEGRVVDAEVTVTFDAELQGQPIPVTYIGTVQGDGSLSGTLDIADGMLTGTFTAERSGG